MPCSSKNRSLRVSYAIAMLSRLYAALIIALLASAFVCLFVSAYLMQHICGFAGDNNVGRRLLQSGEIKSIQLACAYFVLSIVQYISHVVSF